MRDKHYKVKHIRMDEKTWQKFKEKKKISGLTWNRFIINSIEK